MMKFIQNGEPYVFEHKCTASEKGQMMSEDEKRDLLVENLLDIYGKCNMTASRCAKPKLSFLDKIKGKTVPIYYPDIVIDNFHGTRGQKAYYIVLPKGTETGNIDLKLLPEEMTRSYIKIIYGSVFCLEEQGPDRYRKGLHYASQYMSQAVAPVQVNQPLTMMHNDMELAQIYAEAWQTLDITRLGEILDKDFHYSNDSIFDDMASRNEYLDYLEGKFQALRKNMSIQRIQIARNGESGGWAVLIKQMQTNGEPIVCGFFIGSRDGRILSIEVHEMDMPDF